MLRLEYGSFEDEYNEQIMNCKFITGTENILEIGGNIGRNSLVLAYILNKHNNNNLVTLESNPQFAKQLEHNRDINDLSFHIENCALSKRKLIQGENDCRTMISSTVPKGYISVNTITWEKLCNKYPFTFDTLVLDCEGAFFYILKDMPEILTNIKMILMENDYFDRNHKQYIDDILETNGFGIAYSKAGDHNSFLSCREMFYQVWIKGYKNDTIDTSVFYTEQNILQTVNSFDQDYKNKYDFCLNLKQKKEMLQMMFLYNSGGIYTENDIVVEKLRNTINELNPTFIGIIKNKESLNLYFLASTKYNKIISLILHHFYIHQVEKNDDCYIEKMVGFVLKNFMGVEELQEGYHTIKNERILLLREIGMVGN